MNNTDLHSVRFSPPGLACSKAASLRIPPVFFRMLGASIVALSATSAFATDILWSNNGGSAWLTNTNWTGSVVPTATDTAQFGVNPTGTGGIGINFSNATNAGTQTNGSRIEDVGAIELTSARTSNDQLIGNSSSSAGATGTLRLLGNTVNGVANVILRSNSSKDLTIQNTQSSGNQTMSVSLGNATENKIVIDAAGKIVISTVIKSNSASTPLTIMGAGSGRVDFTNTANTFTGDIKITGGEIRFTDNGSLGNAANTVTVDGGRLGIVNDGLVNLSSRSIFLGQTAGTSISAPGSGVLTYNGVLTDKSGAAGMLVKQGAGTLALGGANIYTGDTSINNGTLQLTTGNDRLPLGTTLNIGQAASANLGIFDLNGRNQTIAGLNSTSGINATSGNNLVTSATAATLTFGGNGTYGYGDGTNANSGVISGAVSIVKNGVGTQSLGDTNTYTGTTEISQGTLLLGSSTALPSTTNVTLSGGTLKTGGFSASTSTLSVVGGTSIIDFTSNTSSLTFTNSSALAWTGLLQIWNWNGGLGGLSTGTESLAFPTSSSLTTDQLAAIQFYDPAGTAIGSGAGFYNGTGQLVPVPEPAAVLASFVLLGVIGYRERRQRRS